MCGRSSGGGRRDHGEGAASAFLAHERIAVTGVSRKAQGHGSNAVYKRLRDRGYEVFAVNPNADEVEGDRCYHDKVRRLVFARKVPKNV